MAGHTVAQNVVDVKDVASALETLLEAGAGTFVSTEVEQLGSGKVLVVVAFKD
jgi:prefoldin subunit 5